MGSYFCAGPYFPQLPVSGRSAFARARVTLGNRMVLWAPVPPHHLGLTPDPAQHLAVRAAKEAQVEGVEVARLGGKHQHTLVEHRVTYRAVEVRAIEKIAILQVPYSEGSVLEASDDGVPRTHHDPFDRARREVLDGTRRMLGRRFAGNECHSAVFGTQCKIGVGHTDGGHTGRCRKNRGAISAVVEDSDSLPRRHEDLLS